MHWTGGVPRVLVAITAAMAATAPSAAAQQPTRYSLAGGCWSLHPGASAEAAVGAERLRLQATTLGSYLLYRPDGTVLAAEERGDGVVAQRQASPAADWRIADAAGGTFTLTPASESPDRVLVAGDDRNLALGPRSGGSATTNFSFRPAEGCAAYPEAELNATGTPAGGDTPYGTVNGFVEGHMHWMTFEYFGGEFHCGRPWHPYGIPYALPDCAAIEGPRGAAAPLQNTLNFGSPAALHDTTGWPRLTEWARDNLTYEGTYWRWVQRAWMGGLRLMVMSVNENRALCELQPRRHNSCNEMSTVRKGFEDIRELQRYVDAQAGGPGKGFFQIVTSPNEARRVINQGRMAVVLEIEISELYDCRGWEISSCDVESVDRQLDEMYDLGVRSSLLLNKFDNPLAGVRFDSGLFGIVINAGNRQSSGSFWSAETCIGDLHDNEIETAVPQGSAFLDETTAALGVTSGTIPVYPPGPHCNTRGLTQLGRHVVRRMMDKGMIVNPDHMSQAAVDDTLTLLESRGYSGVISPHGWMDPGNWPRLWRLGGMAFPGHTRADGYVEEWQRYRPRSTPYYFGWGYGADLGGLSGQPAPTSPDSVSYPFRSNDGSVTFDRQRTGERTFDYTTEGVAHYGLYPEWFEDLRRRGGETFASDMARGAESYLQMWERAEGIAPTECRNPHPRIGPRGLGAIRLGDSWETLLRRAGQPQQRTRAWSWCVAGAGNRRAADVAELSPGGRVELVASTARRRSAGGIAVGTPARRLRGRARAIGRGVYTRRAGRAVYAYIVRGGRVRTIAVASRALARRPASLRSALTRAGAARAAQARPTFVPSEAAAAGRVSGRTIAGAQNPELNRTLAMLCGF